MDSLKRTILYDKHVALGAHLIDFGGFHMPLYYTTITDEHHQVRNDVGMFDVSHMGQIVLQGKDALKFSNYVLSANIQVTDKIQYALLLNDDGGIIDDLMVYPFSENQILLVVNASNIEKDVNHLNQLKKDYQVDVRNLSDAFNCLAIQGPRSYEVLSDIFDTLPKHSSDYIFSTDERGPLLISRSGYTGEDGFEIYAHDQFTQTLWDKLYQAGVTPIGLGARDTLRFEAGMPLYGQEMDESINPFEAGLSFAVDLNKDDFIGKTSSQFNKDNLLRKSVGFELLEKNIARTGYEVYKDGTKIGYVTTGYLTPTTKKALGFALIDVKYAKVDTKIEIKIRNKFVQALVRNKRFIQKNNKV